MSTNFYKAHKSLEIQVWVFVPAPWVSLRINAEKRMHDDFILSTNKHANSSTKPYGKVMCESSELAGNFFS